MGPMVVKAIRKYTNLPFDVHLMMDNPMDFVDAYIEAGADIITVHGEVLPHLDRCIHYIKDKGIKASVALNPATSPSILEYVLEYLDMVLVMTVNPGFGGQKFIKGMLPKIKRVREMIDSQRLCMDIEVDGGISALNIQDVAKAGANIFVAGSAIFGAEDISKTIQNMRNRAI
jgi:ribulose-phosphate 3-epimerase